MKTYSMKSIVADKNLISKCGLYCGACKAYLKGSCPGCEKNDRAKWCKIRTCNLENKMLSCAECKIYGNVMDCEKYNNFMSKIFAFVFGSDRSACIGFIKEKGYESFASYMTENKWQSIKKR